MRNPVDRIVPTIAPITQSLLFLAVGQVVTALMALVYGKLTAVYITPAEWGDYSLLLAIMTLLHSFLVTPTIQSFKAATALVSIQQAIRFYSRILLLIYLTVGPIAALLAGLYYQNSVYYLVWLVAFGQGIYQFGNHYLSSSGQYRPYIVSQIGYAVGNVLLFFVLVIGVDHRTATGLWQSAALLNGLFGTLACWQLHQATHATEFLPEQNIDWADLIRSYKRYAGPLVSLAFWSWLINYADRYLIQLYLTDADVGHYVMGYSLGSKLLILVAPLLTFLSPQLLTLQAAGQSAKSANALLLPYLIRYVLLAGAGCLFYYLGREWIGELLLSDRYTPAFIIGPIVAAGYLLLTSIHLLEIKWYAFGQTRFVLWHNAFGAVLNVALNLLLIPRFGIVGAALATLLGFSGQFLMVIWLFMSEKFNG